MDFGLRDKTVLITGGTRGFGKALCEVMAEEEANIIFTGRNEATVRMLERQLSDTYRRPIFGIVCDLAESGAPDHMFESALKCTGGIDILVNNAAVWPQAYVTEMASEEFEETIKLNLEVPFLLCQKLVVDLMAKKKTGKIINVVSQVAFHGSTTGHAHYAASKGGLVAFTLSLAREVAAYGINVNAIAPGIMQTPMMMGISNEQKEGYLKRIPLGRIAAPKEIAYSAAFLASDKADYLTGITLDATGGMLMR